MQKIPLGNKQYFIILGSGIEAFKGEKNYYSTSSIKGTEILEPENIITHKERPSRANMQPIEGVVCFAKMSQTIKLLKVDEDFAKSSILSTGFSLILPNKNLIDNNYLKYYFFSSGFNSQKDRFSTGTTQVAINNEGIKKIYIPIYPLPTQYLIVQEIEKQFSRLDEGLASLKRTKENLKKYKASVLKSAVEGKLTEEWRMDSRVKHENDNNRESAKELLKKILQARKEKFLAENPGKKYKEPEGIKKEDLLNIKLPEEWEWCNLEQITSKITDGTHKTPNYIKEDDIKGRKVVKFISAKNIKDYKLIVDDFKNILEEEHFELNKKIQLEKGDVFIAKSGSIGQSTVFNLDEEYSIFESLAILKNIDKNMSEYICLFVNSDVGQKQIKSKSKGVAVQHLHLEDIRRLQIPLPPLPEQNEIVKIVESKLSVVEKLEKIVNDNIRKAENLKQSILKKAFEGKLVKEI